jgi:signal transduction histidine kinase
MPDLGSSLPHTAINRPVEDQAAADAARVQAALRHHALLALDALHAARNLAQWALLVAEDGIQAHDDAQRIALAQRLANSAHVIRQRAQSLLAATCRSAAPDSTPVPDLNALIRSCAHMHGVGLHAQGQCATATARTRWIDVLDNLLINIRAHYPGQAVHATLRADSTGMACVEIEPPAQDFGGQMQRLFVPFQSTREGGLGLGLYLARRAARQAGGDLRALEHPARFRLCMP